MRSGAPKVAPMAAAEELILAHVGREHCLVVGEFTYAPHHLAHKQRTVGGMNGGLDDL